MKTLITAIVLACALIFSVSGFTASKTDIGSMLPQTSMDNVQQAPLHGNFKTMKYHNAQCDHYDCKTCTKIFRTKAAAEKAGYVPCGKCGG